MIKNSISTPIIIFTTFFIQKSVSLQYQEAETGKADYKILFIFINYDIVARLMYANRVDPNGNGLNIWYDHNKHDTFIDPKKVLIEVYIVLFFSLDFFLNRVIKVEYVNNGQATCYFI